MIVKIILILACSLSGYSIAYHSYSQWWQWTVGLFLGLLIAIFVIKIEQAIRKVALRVILGGVVGMIIGLLIAFLFVYGLSFVSNIMEKRQVVPWIYSLLTGIMGYLGLVLGSKKVEEVSLFGWGTGQGDQRLSHSGYQRHHRRPDRGHLRHRFHGGQPDGSPLRPR